MDRRQAADLDRHITGNWGEDSVGEPLSDDEAGIEIAAVSTVYTVEFQRCNGEPMLWVGDYEGGRLTLPQLRAIVAILERVK